MLGHNLAILAEASRRLAKRMDENESVLEFGVSRKLQTQIELLNACRLLSDTYVTEKVEYQSLE